jgi:hypothetical protein
MGPVDEEIRAILFTNMLTNINLNKKVVKKILLTQILQFPLLRTHLLPLLLPHVHVEIVVKFMEKGNAKRN